MHENKAFIENMKKKKKKKKKKMKMMEYDNIS